MPNTPSNQMQNFFNPNPIEKKLNLHFNDPSLLQLAFTHRSFWNEHQDLTPAHNERLEFLGDSVLGLIIAAYLFKKYPDLDEGVLSSLRSGLVDAPACVHYAEKLELASFLLLGKGEQMNRGKGRESILADLFEAIIGALYLDQGLEATQNFFFAHFGEDVDQQIATPGRNWKAELQDWAQKQFQEPPLYTVTGESGPPHKRIFHVVVSIQGKEWGEGAGHSKKEAQMAAAKEAVLKIEKQNE